jgi:hypothetical protein
MAWGLGKFFEGRSPERLVEQPRRELRREREGQAERAGQLRAKRAGTEQPDSDLRARARHGLDALARRGRREIKKQVLQQLREPIARLRIAAERAGRGLVRTGGPAEPKVDAAGVKRIQCAELLGDDERRVVRQHDAAGTDAQRGGGAGDMADQHRRGRAGDAGHVMMFRQPKPRVAQPLHQARKLDRVAETFRDRSALPDGSKVEHGKGDGHPPTYTEICWRRKRVLPKRAVTGARG